MKVEAKNLVCVYFSIQIWAIAEEDGWNTSSARLSSWLPGLKVMQGMRGMKGMQGMKGMLRKLDEGYVAEIAFAQGPRWHILHHAVNSNHSFCDDLDDFDDEKESSCSYCAPSFENKGDDPDTREWFLSRVGSRNTPK